jgi:Mn-dependent DtxR family transcriptional regulator
MSNTSKTQRLYNLLQTGENTSAKALAKALKVKSVTSLVTALRKQGAVIYTNKTSNGPAYRYDTVRSYV